MHAYRTHNCGQLRLADASAAARLSGWVHRKRDHGNLLFIDLRDHFGITQCVVESTSPKFPEIEALRLEAVITVTGKTEKNFKTLVFDKQGVLVRATADVDSPGGGKTELTITWKYVKFADKYAPASWTVSLELTGMGKYTETTKLTYEKMGDYQVPKLAEASGSIGGNTTATKQIEFSDWKFNDDVS